MRVTVQQLGDEAAVRIPAEALKCAGLRVGQSLDLRVEAGKLVLKPAVEVLDDLRAGITPENLRGEVFDGRRIGDEAW
jgi:antitoxin MazE